MMKRVLLVEDDNGLRPLLAKQLRRHGYEVFEAADGYEAEAILSARPIDLVISDVLMPGKDGIELLMSVRSKYPDLHMVAMSGGGHTATGTYLNVAKALGASRTLLKPFEAAELISVVESELAA